MASATLTDRERELVATVLDEMICSVQALIRKLDEVDGRPALRLLAAVKDENDG